MAGRVTKQRKKHIEQLKYCEEGMIFNIDVEDRVIYTPPPFKYSKECTGHKYQLRGNHYWRDDARSRANSVEGKWRSSSLFKNVSCEVSSYGSSWFGSGSTYDIFLSFTHKDSIITRASRLRDDELKNTKQRSVFWFGNIIDTIPSEFPTIMAKEECGEYRLKEIARNSREGRITYEKIGGNNQDIFKQANCFEVKRVCLEKGESLMRR